MMFWTGFVLVSVLAAEPTATLRVDSAAGCLEDANRALVGVPITGFNIEGAMDVTTGAAGGSASGALQPFGVKVTKALDACTIDLFRLFTAGRHVRRVELRIYDANKTETFLVLLDEAIISGASYAPGGEEVRITPQRITVQFTGPRGPVKACWDFAARKAC